MTGTVRALLAALLMALVALAGATLAGPAYATPVPETKPKKPHCAECP